MEEGWIGFGKEVEGVGEMRRIDVEVMSDWGLDEMGFMVNGEIGLQGC